MRFYCGAKPTSQTAPSAWTRLLRVSAPLRDTVLQLTARNSPLLIFQATPDVSHQEDSGSESLRIISQRVRRWTRECSSIERHF